MSKPYHKRKFEESSNGQDSKKFRGAWKYSAKDKAKWPDLINLRDRKLLEKSLSYVISEDEILKLSTPIIVPTPKLFTKLYVGDDDEADNDKEARIFLNRLLERAYNNELIDRKRDLKQLDHDSQTYIGIIYDSLVVTAIRDELQDYERSHCSKIVINDA